MQKAFALAQQYCFVALVLKFSMTNATNVVNNFLRFTLLIQLRDCKSGIAINFNFCFWSCKSNIFDYTL